MQDLSLSAAGSTEGPCPKEVTSSAQAEKSLYINKKAASSNQRLLKLLFTRLSVSSMSEKEWRGFPDIYGEKMKTKVFAYKLALLGRDAGIP